MLTSYARSLCLPPPTPPTPPPPPPPPPPPYPRNPRTPLLRCTLQVNTAAAERLCTLLRSQCGLTPRSVLLDVCCGAGMIGLTMAPAVRHVRGIGDVRTPNPNP